MKWIAVVLICTQLTGCATVLLKDQEPIAIDSRPSGANAAVQCAGGTTKTIPLDRGYNGAFWSNFSLAAGLPGSFGFWFGGGSTRAIAALAVVGAAGVIGFVVDRRNGRAYRHFPDEINEVLEPIR